MSEKAQFALRVQKIMTEVVAHIQSGRLGMAEDVATELCSEAFRIVDAERQARELADPDRFDLTKLPAIGGE